MTTQSAVCYMKSSTMVSGLSAHDIVVMAFPSDTQGNISRMDLSLARSKSWSNHCIQCHTHKFGFTLLAPICNYENEFFKFNIPLGLFRNYFQRFPLYSENVNTYICMECEYLHRDLWLSWESNTLRRGLRGFDPYRRGSRGVVVDLLVLNRLVD